MLPVKATFKCLDKPVRSRFIRSWKERTQSRRCRSGVSPRSCLMLNAVFKSARICFSEGEGPRFSPDSQSYLWAKKRLSTTTLRTGTLPEWRCFLGKRQTAGGRPMPLRLSFKVKRHQRVRRAVPEGTGFLAHWGKCLMSESVVMGA